MKRIPFTDEERAYIIENYARTGNKQLASHLGRSVHSITRFADMNGLRKDDDFISPGDCRAMAMQYSVVLNDRVVFIGGRRQTAEYIGVTLSMITAAAKRGMKVKGEYFVRYKQPNDTATEVPRRSEKVKTDTMDWPLWFFKSGLAPESAIRYNKIH